MKPQWKIHRATFALLCAVAAGGCDSRQPLGPATRSIARRASVEAPQALGGGFVPAPSNTSPAAVSNPPYVNLLTLPESTWVVLNVTGNVQLTWNEAPCAQRAIEMPNWACQNGSPLVNFAAGPWEGGPVWLRTGEGSGGQVRLRGTGGANSGAAIGLYYAAQAVTLTGHVNMTAQWAPDPNFGNGPFSYHVSGGYSVAATAVPSPLQLTEGEPDSTGERPYTVEALYGLQFINPVGYPGHIPAGATFWRFFPGDSVGDTPDRTGGGWDVRECQNQMVCRYRPPGPGRMQVQAYVEGQFADVRSKRAPGQCSTASSLRPDTSFASGIRSVCAPAVSPRLSVTCSPPITRGTNVSCRAFVSPAMPFTIVRREATADRIAVTDTTHEDYAAGDTAEWSGVAIASSRVRITAVISQEGSATTVSGTSRFSVRERPWTAYQIVRPTVLHEIQATQMKLVPPPFGVMNLTEFSYNTTPVASVTSGPNAGVLYFADQLQFAGGIATINLHPALYGRFSGDPWGVIAATWYNDQNGNGGPAWSSNHIYRSCAQSDMSTLRSELERHEGVTLASNSHVGVANRVFQSSKLHERFERFYRQNISVEQFRWDAEGVYTNWWATDYLTPQKNFDRGPLNDTNPTWAAIGCETDDDLQAP